MPLSFITGDDDDDDDDDSSWYQGSVDVPGTDYYVTTDRSEANVVDPVETGGQVVDEGRSRASATGGHVTGAVDHGQDRVTGAASGTQDFVTETQDRATSAPSELQDRLTSPSFETPTRDDFESAVSGVNERVGTESITDHVRDTDLSVGDPRDVVRDAEQRVTDATPSIEQPDKGEVTTSGISLDFDDARRAGSTVRETATETADSGSRLVGHAARGEGWQAADAAGETVLNLATGGDAHGFREDFIEHRGEENIEQWRESALEGIEEGGVWGHGSALYEATATGATTMYDSPRGPNIQEAGRDAAISATGAEDAEELGRRAQSTRDRWMDVRSAPSRALPDWAPGSEGTLTAQAGGFLLDIPQWSAEAAWTAGTGTDPVTGEHGRDVRARPEDLFLAPLDAMTGGAILRGGGRTLARRMGRSGDDAAETAARGTTTTRATDDVVEEASTRNIGPAIDTTPSAAARTTEGGRAAGRGPSPNLGGVGEAVGAGLVGGAALIGGGRAGSEMARRLPRLLRGADTTGDVARTGRGVQEAGGRGVGTSADAFRFTEDLTSTARVGEEGVPAGARAGTDTSIDQVLSTARVTDDAATAGRGADDVIDMTRGDDGVFRAAADTTEDLLPATVRDTTTDVAPAVARTADDVGTTTARAVDDAADTLGANVGSTIFGAARGADDVGTAAARTVDDAGAAAARTADDVTGAAARTADDIAGATTVTGRVSNRISDGLSATRSRFSTEVSNFGSWWGRRTRGQRIALGGLGAIFGGTIVADLLGWEVDLSPPSGDREGDNWRAGHIDDYTLNGQPIASLFRIESGGGEWETQGYSVYVGPIEHEEDASLFGVSPGTEVVVSPEGRPTEMQAVEEINGDPIPSPEHPSREAADDAAAAFKRWLEGEIEDDVGTTDTEDPDDHPDISGSLNTPSEVGQGEEFTAEWQVEVSGDIEQADSRVHLVLLHPQQAVELAEDQLHLGADQSTDGGTFEVPGGWAIEAGDYDVVVGMWEGDDLLSLAEDSLSVTGDPDEEDDTWGEPEVVEELPYGWFIVAQPRLDGSEEVRFMIVGTQEDGTHIYIQSNGQVAESPDYYASIDEAAEAFERWLARHEDGQTDEEEVPEGGPHPDMGQVHQDAQAVDQSPAGQARGLISSIRRFAVQNPLLFTGIVVAAGVGVWWLHREGHLDRGLTRVRTTLGRFNP